MANRPTPRMVEVISSHKVTPNMLRVTLGGSGMTDFPKGQEGGYIKLMLPPAPGSKKPTIRTYTIRRQKEGLIDVDFALHEDTRGHAGPATRWAMTARPGDKIIIGGPGPAKPLPNKTGWYFIAGDMTALPAISVNLERLDRHARGAAIIEIISEDDRQELDHPTGIEIIWNVNPKPGQASSTLTDAIRSLGWPEEEPYAWVACEFSSMRTLRDYLNGERGLGREQLYISSYWKSGINEDAHKVAKREDAEA